MALGTQYITVPFHIIIQKGIGIISTVITSIVAGHKSVSVILCKLNNKKDIHVPFCAKYSANVLFNCVIIQLLTTP